MVSFCYVLDGFLLTPELPRYFNDELVSKGVSVFKDDTVAEPERKKSGWRTKENGIVTGFLYDAMDQGNRKADMHLNDENPSNAHVTHRYGWEIPKRDFLPSQTDYHKKDFAEGLSERPFSYESSTGYDTRAYRNVQPSSYDSSTGYDTRAYRSVQPSSYDSSTGYDTRAYRNVQPSSYDSSTGYDTRAYRSVQPSSYDSSTGYDTRAYRNVQPSSYDSSTGYDTRAYRSVQPYALPYDSSTGYDMDAHSASVQPSSYEGSTGYDMDAHSASVQPSSYDSSTGYDMDAHSASAQPSSYDSSTGYDMDAHSASVQPSSYDSSTGYDMDAHSVSVQPSSYDSSTGYDMDAHSASVQPSSYDSSTGYDMDAHSASVQPSSYEGSTGYDMDAHSASVQPSSYDSSTGYDMDAHSASVQPSSYDSSTGYHVPAGRTTAKTHTRHSGQTTNRGLKGQYSNVQPSSLNGAKYHRVEHLTYTHPISDHHYGGYIGGHVTTDHYDDQPEEPPYGDASSHGYRDEEMSYRGHTGGMLTPKTKANDRTASNPGKSEYKAHTVNLICNSFDKRVQVIKSEKRKRRSAEDKELSDDGSHRKLIFLCIANRQDPVKVETGA